MHSRARGGFRGALVQLQEIAQHNDVRTGASCKGRCKNTNSLACVVVHSVFACSAARKTYTSNGTHFHSSRPFGICNVSAEYRLLRVMQTCHKRNWKIGWRISCAVRQTERVVCMHITEHYCMCFVVDSTAAESTSFVR